MDLQQVIAQGGGLGAIAGQLGISEGEASRGIDALLPAVLGGFKKNAQGAGGGDAGLGNLIALAQGAGGGGLLDTVLGGGATDVGAGNDILGQIFGSKDVSRTVAAHASGQTGLDSGVLRKLLPVVAMLVAGYMARSSGNQGGGGLGGVLGSVLGGGQSSGGGDALGGILGSVLGGSSGGGLGGVLGSVLGGGQSRGAPAGGGLGGLGALLDLDGDGNPLDDIIGMAGKLTGR